MNPVLSLLVQAGAAVVAALWWYFPAFVANAVPVVIFPFVRQWNRPIWEKGLGSNKTWIGLVSGILAGVLAGWLQISLTNWIFGGPLWILWSALIAFGALFGDITKSYFKRRLGMKPGSPWPVVDGIDYVLGALVIGMLLFVPRWDIAVALVILGPILSLLANIFSYLVGLKKVWH